jgi:hypothetical protein
MARFLILRPPAPACAKEGALDEKLARHRHVQIEKRRAEQRLPRRDREEVLPAHEGGRVEDRPEEPSVPALCPKLYGERHSLAQAIHLARDRVELPPRDDRLIASAHAAPEARDEVTRARHDEERALHRVVDRDCDTRRPLGQGRSRKWPARGSASRAARSTCCARDPNRARNTQRGSRRPAGSRCAPPPAGRPGAEEQDEPGDRSLRAAAAGKRAAARARRRLGICCIAFLFACAGAGFDEGEDKCPNPRTILLPPNGNVPPKPVLILLTGWDPPPLVARVNGVKVPLTVRPDPRAWGTHRVEIDATTPGLLEVGYSIPWGRSETWLFTVDPSWKPPQAAAASISVQRVKDEWRCSHTLERKLVFMHPAWAFRVVAAGSAAELASGATREVVLPRSMDAFYHDRLKGSEAVLELGDVGCYGPTFDWKQGPVVLQVRALLPDGSEQPVTATPLAVAPP